MTKMIELTKKISKSLVLGGLALSAFSCSSDEATSSYIELNIQLELEGANASSLAGRKVILTSENNRSVEATTDAQSIAKFTQLIPGRYAISSSSELSSTQYTSLLGKQVGATEYILTGNLAQELYSVTTTKKLKLSATAKSDLVISKVYYSGGKDNNGKNSRGAIYVEIYNNSDKDIELGKDYYFALNESFNPIKEIYANQKNQDVFAKQVYKFPSNTLKAGASILIVNQAINHKSNATNEPDLSNADFQVLDPTGKIAEQSNAISLEALYSNIKTNLNLTVGPASLFIFKTDENVEAWEKLSNGTNTSDSNKALRVPTKTIVDAVDILAQKNPSPDIKTKRFPEFLDAGFASVTANNAHWVVARKIASSSPVIKLQDTNNSSNDFVPVQYLEPRNYTYKSSNN